MGIYRGGSKNFDETTGTYINGYVPEPRVRIPAVPSMPTGEKRTGSKFSSVQNFSSSMRVASPDIILFDSEALPIELMTDLIFENIGGREILNISRSDIVNGQKIIYQPIKNLAQINLRYNPLNILAVQNASDKLFRGFSIEFGNYVPSVGNGVSGQPVYFDANNGDLVVDLVNIKDGDEVEIQILSAGDILDDTIYIEEDL